MSVKAEIEIGDQDIEAFIRYHAATAPHLVRRTRTYRWVWAGLIGVYGAVRFQQFPAFGIVALIVAVVMFFSYGRLAQYFQVRQDLKMYRNGARVNTGHFAVFFDGESLSIEGEQASAALKASAVATGLTQSG